VIIQDHRRHLRRDDFGGLVYSENSSFNVLTGDKFATLNSNTSEQQKDLSERNLRFIRFQPGEQTGDRSEQFAENSNLVMPSLAMDGENGKSDVTPTSKGTTSASVQKQLNKINANIKIVTRWILIIQIGIFVCI
jgi:hypothetical protein